MKYKIEKNVPVNKRNTHMANYPFGDMQIGDSFLVPNEDIKSVGFQASLLSTAKSWARFNNIEARFTTRKQKDGMRIFRIK